MKDLRPYVVFAETVAAGSMSAAARRLGMTPSAVSQIIRALEHQTGVKLLHRSTRKLSLTEAGERCYPHCVRLIDAASAATSSLDQARDAPSGELRIAAPVGFGAHVAPALAPVLAEWPHLHLRLIVDDALIDLIDARIDIAVRVGALADSTWISRKLCDFERVLCASPAYLERNGIPETIADLQEHDWLARDRDVPDTGAAGGDVAPTFALDVRQASAAIEHLTVPTRISTTSQIALQQMCEQGMGIARLFYADARHALDQGRLVRVMPRLRLPSLPVTMVTPDREPGSAKARVAIAALKRYFATLAA